MIVKIGCVVVLVVCFGVIRKLLKVQSEQRERIRELERERQASRKQAEEFTKRIKESIKKKKMIS